MNHHPMSQRHAGSAGIMVFGSGAILLSTIILLVLCGFASGFGARHGLKGILLAFNKKETLGVVERRIPANINVGGSKSRPGKPVYKTFFSFIDANGAERAGISFSTRGPDVPSVYEGTKIPLDVIESFVSENPGKTPCIVEYSPLLPIAARMRGYSASPIGRGTAIFMFIILALLAWVGHGILTAFRTRRLLEIGVLTNGTILQVLEIKGKNHRVWRTPQDFAANPPSFFRDGSTVSYQVMFSAGGHGQITLEETADLTMAMLHGAPIALIFDPENPKHARLLHGISGLPLPDAHGTWTPQAPGAAMIRMAFSVICFIGSGFMLFVVPKLMGY